MHLSRKCYIICNDQLTEAFYKGLQLIKLSQQTMNILIQNKYKHLNVTM